MSGCHGEAADELAETAGARAAAARGPRGGMGFALGSDWALASPKQPSATHAQTIFIHVADLIESPLLACWKCDRIRKKEILLTEPAGIHGIQQPRWRSRCVLGPTGKPPPRCRCQLTVYNRGASLADRESNMSKAKDTRKDTKKKPAKNLMEKRAAKKEKKASRLFRG